MGRPIEPEDAAAFWETRYARGLLYGTEPTSVARQLVPVFHREKVSTLLEAGCASGRDALHYAREGFVVTALDLSRNALRRARRLAESAGLSLDFTAGDLLTANLPLAGFDAAVAVHLIHLQPEPYRRAMVNRLWSLTRDGGIIAMANYSTEEAGFATWEPYPESTTRIDPKGKLVHFFDAEEMAAYLPTDSISCNAKW